MSLVSRNLLDLLSITRTTATVRWNKDGVLEDVPAGVPCLTYDPDTHKPKGYLCSRDVMNWVRNNTMVGAVVDVNGVTDKAPDLWGISKNPEISGRVVNKGIEDGIDFIDVRFVGLSTSSKYAQIVFDIQGHPAVAADMHTLSVYMKKVAGDFSNLKELPKLILRSIKSDGTGLGQYVVRDLAASEMSAASIKTNRLSVSSSLDSFTNTSTAFIIPYLQFYTDTTGPVDLTIRVGLPQLEKYKTASMPVKTAGAAVWRCGDAPEISGKNFTDAMCFNRNAGTIIVEFECTIDFLSTHQWESPGVFSINDASLWYYQGYALAIRFDTTADTFSFGTRNNGGTNACGSASVRLPSKIRKGQKIRAVCAYSASGVSLSVNGSAVSKVANTEFATMVLSRVQLGFQTLSNNNPKLDSPIKLFSFIPREYTPSEMQAASAI